MKNLNDDVYGGIYYNDDKTMICINVSSDFPITSKEFFAYLKLFLDENKGLDIESIGELVHMELEHQDPSMCN